MENMSFLTPLPHQKTIINHLVASCPGQHGLLVAHQMGGGKTFTALMFMQNYRRSRHVIICPSFLKDLYGRESLKLLGKPLRDTTVVLDYDELHKCLRVGSIEFLRNAVLIMDEAHYLLEMFTNLPATTFQQYYEVLMSLPKKSLIMTGTPVYNAVTDLRILINIAAGKEVVPFREIEYINAFTSPNRFTTASFGYFVTALTSKWTKGIVAAVTAYSVYTLNKFTTVDVLNMITLKAVNKVLERVPGESGLANDPEFFEGLVKGIATSLTYEKISEWSIPAGMNTLNQFSTSLWNFVISHPSTNKYVKFITNEKTKTLFLILLGFNFLMNVYKMLSMLKMLHSRLSSQNDPMFYRVMDYEKMKRALGPYLSFYKLRAGTNGIPTTKENEINLMYDSHQTKLWTRMLYNFLTDQDMVDLGITKKTLDYSDGVLPASPVKQVNPQMYENFGRMISNTAPNGKFPPKYEKCFELMCKPWKDKRPHSAVVYSDFEKGTASFLKFLEYKRTGLSFRYEVLTPFMSPSQRSVLLDEFGEQKIDVMVLYAGMYEGISFLKAAQLHILDPPQSYKSLAQLMGRVVRIHSHTGLPLEEQTVEYFHYIANFSPGFIQFITQAVGTTVRMAGNKVGQMTEVLRIWKDSQTFRQKLPSSYNPTILETLTPEALTASRLRPLRQLMMSLETKISTTVKLPAMQCCPKYETDGVSSECLEEHLSPCDFE